MGRAVALLFLLLAAGQPAMQACDCTAGFTICNSVSVSNLVFIGTVESIDPILLSRWDKTRRASLATFNAVFADALERPSPAVLGEVKESFLKLFPNLADYKKNQLEAFKTVLEVAALFQSEVGKGMTVTFRVKTLFKYEDDDDRKAKRPAEKKDDVDDKEEPKAFEVRTPFGDCGNDFQIGETYLVYANEEEGADRLFTHGCSRTRRLSDAGEDLAYLFFYKDNHSESSRLEGFATTDRTSLLDFSQLPDTVRSPSAGIIVEVKSNRLTRYTETDRKGKFIFDGLAEGDYQVSAIASGGNVQNPRPLAGPYTVHLPEAGCGRQLLVVPRTQ